MDCATSRRTVIVVIVAIAQMWSSWAELGLCAVSSSTTPVAFPSAIISQVTIPTCIGDPMTISTPPSSSLPTNVSVSPMVLSLAMRTCMRQGGTNLVAFLQPELFAKDFQVTITPSPCPTVTLLRVGGVVAVSEFVGIGSIKIYCTPSASLQTPPTTGAYLTQSIRQTIDVSVMSNSSEALFPPATSTCISPSPLQVSVVANQSAFVLPAPPRPISIIPTTSTNDIVYTIASSMTTGIVVNYTLKACAIVAGVATDRCVTVVDTRSGVRANDISSSVRGVSYFTITTYTTPTTPFYINISQISSFGRSCYDVIKFVAATHADMPNRLPTPIITTQSIKTTTASSSSQLVVTSSILALTKGGTSTPSTVSAFYNTTANISVVRITSPSNVVGITSLTVCTSTTTTSQSSCSALALGSSKDVAVMSAGLTIKIDFATSEPFSAPVFISPITGNTSGGADTAVSTPVVLVLHVVAPLPAVMTIVTPSAAPVDVLTSILSVESVSGSAIASNKQIGQLLGKITIVVLSGGCKVGVNAEKGAPAGAQVTVVDGTTTYKVLPAVGTSSPSYCTLGVLSDSLDDMQGTLWFVNTATTTSATTTTTASTTPETSATINTTTTKANTSSTTPATTSTSAATPNTTTTTSTTAATETTSATATTTTTTTTKHTTFSTTTTAPATLSTTKATTTTTTTTEAPTSTTTTSEPTTTPTSTTASSPRDVDESSTSPLKWLYNNFLVVFLVFFIIVLLVCFKETLWKLLQSNFPGIFGQYEGLVNDDGDTPPHDDTMGGQVDETATTIFQANRSGHQKDAVVAPPTRSLSPQVGVRRKVAPVEGSDDVTAIDMTAIVPSARPVMKRVSQPPAAASDVVTDEEDSDFDNFFASKTASPHSSPPMPPPVPVVIHKAISRPAAAASTAPSSESNADVNSRPGSALRRGGGGGGGLQLNTATKPQKPTGKKSTTLRGGMANKLPLATKPSSSSATGKDNFLENFFDAPPPTTHSDGTTPAAASPPKKSSTAASGWGDDDDWIE